MKTRPGRQKEHPWVHALTCELSPDLTYQDLKQLQEYMLDFLRDVPMTSRLKEATESEKFSGRQTA
jgi:hypothetical protein